LVQLAKKEKAQDFLVDCALPAQKKPSGVSVEGSLSKILADKLSDFVGDTEPTIQSIPQPEERVEESKLFGINTKYLRYVCTVLVETSEDAMTVMATRSWRPTRSDVSAANASHVRPATLHDSGALRQSHVPVELAEEMGPHRMLLDRKVHPVGADGKITWYAWVTEAEFAFLKRAEVKPLLRSWLVLCATDLEGRPLQRLEADAAEATSPGNRASARRISHWQMADQAVQSAGNTVARVRASVIGGAPLTPRRSGGALSAPTEDFPEETARREAVL
jgi:hypothetical protein